MTSPLLGLHHVTATVTDAREDLDFYTRLLGLRLVKKTVNFDNHHVYHFYYGDERGTPGTIWTTFPYKGMGVPQGTHGAGQIGTTSFSVPAGSLDFWHARITEARIAIHARGTRLDEEWLAFPDPSGLRIELVATARDVRAPWTTREIGPEHAIRGLFGVTLVLREVPRSVDFLVELLGAEVAGQTDTVTRMALGGSAPGHCLDLLHAPDAALGRNGLGTVHHVAMAIGDEEGQLALREKLVRAGAHVTEVRDRQYFKSIYFREPGGVLYEVATMKPGFTVDEPLDQLGRGLKLPPWEEPNRADIETHLPRVGQVG